MKRDFFLLAVVMGILGANLVAFARDLFKPLVQNVHPKVEVLFCANQECLPEVRYEGGLLEEGEIRGKVKLIRREKDGIILLINGIVCHIKRRQGI